MIFCPKLLSYFPEELVILASNGCCQLYISKDNKQLIAAKTILHREKIWKKEFDPEYLYSKKGFSFEGSKWTKKGNPLEWTLLLTEEMNKIMKKEEVPA